MTEIELMFEIGDNIKRMLDESWMTQKELADYTRIDKSTISRYISGTTMPSLKNIINIANVLDCDLTDLVSTRKFIY